MNTDKPSGRVLEGLKPSGARSLELKKGLTPEQKERKNELARALRAKKRFEKQVMGGSSPSAEIDEEDMEDTEDTQVTQVTEDPEITRKKEIAEKRRASLALARVRLNLSRKSQRRKMRRLKK